MVTQTKLKGAYIVCVFDPENLFTEFLKVVEGGLSSDGVDQEEALTVLHVQVTHSCELFLHSKAHMNTSLLCHIMVINLLSLFLQDTLTTKELTLQYISFLIIHYAFFLSLCVEWERRVVNEK